MLAWPSFSDFIHFSDFITLAYLGSFYSSCKLLGVLGLGSICSCELTCCLKVTMITGKNKELIITYLWDNFYK